LPVIAQRRPAMADHCITQMTLGNHSSRACFRATAAAGAFLRAHGWEACPSWEAFRTPSASHPRLDAGDLALHGWQHAATLATLHPTASGSCFPPLQQLAKPKQALRLAPGSQPSRGDCGGHCHSPTPAAGLGLVPPAAGLPLMPSATTPWRAHEVARSPDGRAFWNVPGYTSLGKAKAGLSMVVPQQLLAHTPAPVASSDQCRLDLVVHGATPHGEALCCDATLVSPLTRTMGYSIHNWFLQSIIFF
jgi:hypothetical protein